MILPMKYWIFSIFLVFTLSWGDDEEDWEDPRETDEYYDAVSKQSNVEATSGRFEGIFLETNDETEFKEVKMLFIFSELPYYGSTYFSYYDSTKNALILDFYDTYLGASILDSIVEDPITGSKFEELHVNLNEGVEGFEPDMRDLVRVTLYTDYPFEYNLEPDEFDVLTLYFAWSDQIRNRLEKKESSSPWWLYMLLGVGVLGGVGLATYLAI